MTPFRIILLFLIVSLFGFLLLSRLPLDLVPTTSKPTITISFDLPNASPDIVEQTATSILENAFAQISQLNKIYSVSSFGSGQIELTFNKDANLPFKRFEINSIIRRLHNKLPSGSSYPEIKEDGIKKDSNSPLLVYQLNANLAASKIEKSVRSLLLNSISQISGVKSVSLNGAQPVQLTIAFDNEKARYLGVNIKNLPTELTKLFKTNYPGAILTHGKQRFTIKSGRSAEKIDEIKSSSIPTSNENYVLLSDFAQVYLEESQPKEFFRVNGETAITIAVYADEGINRLILAGEIKALVKERFKSFPEGYSITLDYDDTEYLEKEISKNIIRSVTSLIVLLIFLLIFYRNKKHLFVLFSGIFVSIGLTSLTAYFLRLQINLYSIAGITISLGIIIDNSIVVIDHIRTKGRSSIARAIIGAALTTITALLLVFLLPEEDRRTLSDFCIWVSVAVAMSVLTAIFFTPAFARAVSIDSFKDRPAFKKLRQDAVKFRLYSKFILKINEYRIPFLIVLILFFGLPIFLLPSKWENQEWYNKSVGSTLYQESIRPVTDKLLGGALRLFVLDISEKKGYREKEQVELTVYAELPFGNSLTSMDRVMKGVEDYLSEVKGVEKYITEVSSGQNGKIIITFDKTAERTSLPFSLRRKLISMSNNWNGVNFMIIGVGDTFENNSKEGLSSFRVEMRGYNYTQLEKYAESLKRKLLTHKRILNVNKNDVLKWNEKQIEILELKFHNTSLLSNNVEAAENLKSNSEQNSPSLFLSIKGESTPIFIQPKQTSPTIYSVINSSFQNSDNQTTKLASTSTLKKSILPNAIHKEDRQYLRILSFDYTGSSHFGSEYLSETLQTLKLEMIPGFTAKPDKELWDWEKTKRQYELIVLLIIAIYFIGSILFENLKQPLLIILTIPLSFIGPFLAFTIFGFYFDQGGYASLILLGGLVVNASIYIINDLNNEMRYKYNRRVLKATAGKMKPITLTIFSTCFGLLPFMMLGQNEVFWFALSLGTTSGLILSLGIIFILLPVFLIKKNNTNA